MNRVRISAIASLATALVMLTAVHSQTLEFAIRQVDASNAQLHSGLALNASTIWVGINQGTVITSAK